MEKGVAARQPAVTTPERQEKREFVELVHDERTLRIVHRLSLRDGKLKSLAAEVFYKLIAVGKQGSVQIDAAEMQVPEPLLAALRFEIESQRMLYGDESVPERQAFLESRRNTQEHVRQLKMRLDREYFDSTTELLTEKEKRESVLHTEVKEILVNVAREMGFQRPIELEISRDPKFNAFILSMAKEGQDFNLPSKEPLHVFVNAGLIRKFQQMFAEDGKQFTKDHLAGILGHELRHLMQPEYDLDKPGKATKDDASKRHEYDADVAGMEAADQAGYNPAAMIENFEMLRKKMKGGWKDQLGQYFSDTHPLDENRIKNLYEEYHRADRVLYSATAEYQAFSPEVFVEAKELTREELLEKLTAVRSIDGWNAILDEIEQNPRTTVRDLEVAMNFFKVHLDVRSAMAAAVRELQTGELGLREAILYSCNAKFSGKGAHFDLLGDISHARDLPKYIKDSVIGDIANEAEDDLLKEYGSSVIRAKEVTRIVDFTFEHLLMEPAEGGPFSSVDDLLNPDSDEAQKLWKVGHPNFYPREHTVAEMQQARHTLVAKMTAILLGGVEIRSHYRGEELEAKEAILAEMAKMKEVAQQPEAATSAFPKNFGDIVAAVQRRVSLSGAVPKILKPSAPMKYVPERNFEVRAYPFHGPELVDGKIQVVDDQTPLRRLTARIIRMARREFDKSLSSETLQAKLGEIVADVPEVKDWLFEKAYVAPLMSTEDEPFETIPVKTVKQLEEWEPLSQYVRALPTHERRYYAPNNSAVISYLPSTHNFRLVKQLSIMLQAQLTWRVNTASVLEIGNDVERIRVLAHSRVVAPLMGTHHYERGESVADPELKEILNHLTTPYSAKVALVSRWVKDGLRVNGEGGVSNAQFIRESKTILIEAAKAKGLPDDFFLQQFHERQDKKETWGDWLRKVMPSIFKPTEPAENVFEVKRALERVASEFFAAHFADGIQELAWVKPSTIHDFTP